MFRHLILYSTSHCHLCELAHSLVLNNINSIEFKIIDIADDEELLLRYSLRIPVLQLTDTGVELDWPFNKSELMQFLSK